MNQEAIIIELKLTEEEALILKNDILEFFRIQHEYTTGDSIMRTMRVLEDIQKQLVDGIRKTK